MNNYGLFSPPPNSGMYPTTSSTQQPAQKPSSSITDPRTWLTPRWGEQTGLASSLTNILSGLGYKGTNYGGVQDINQLAQAAGMNQEQLTAFYSQLEQQNGKQFLNGNPDEYVRNALQGRAANNELSNWMNQNGYRVNTQDTGSLQIQDLFDAQGNKLGSDTFDYQSYLNKENKAVNTTAAVTAAALGGLAYYGAGAAGAGAAGSGSIPTGGGVGGLGGSAGGAAYLPAGAYNPAIGNTIGGYVAGTPGVGSIGGSVATGIGSAGGGTAASGLGGTGGSAIAGAGGTGASAATSAATQGANGMGWMDWAEKLWDVGSKVYDAKNAKDAASGLASSQQAAAQAAAEESRFRPIGVTNAFGSSNFTFDPVTGRLSGASYNVDPKLQAIRDQLMTLAGGNSQQLGNINQAYQQGQQGMLGSIANAGDIQGQTQRLFQQRQDLLAPQRERDLANLRNASFQSGRSGLSVGGTDAGGFAASNPEMQAFFNAQRQKDNELLASSEQDARNYRSNDLSTMAGLFSGQSGAISPILQYLQGSGGVEELGRSGFDLGTALGGRIANPSGGQMLQSGLNSAAQSNLAAQNIQNGMYSSVFGSLADILKDYNKKPTSGGGQ